jgi:Histidine kinase-, DNA gyrase B-, and HSP90-like ATPase
VGLDTQRMNRLFDAFYTTKASGIGIGLSVSRSIIENHRGHLWAEPNDGPGTTFSFSILCRREGSAEDVHPDMVEMPPITDARPARPMAKALKCKSRAPQSAAACLHQEMQIF